MLDVVSRAYAGEHEAGLVAAEARNETWVVLGDNGDGTWTGKFVIPDLQAQMLLDRPAAPVAATSAEPQPRR